jgi:hypothetical protein
MDLSVEMLILENEVNDRGLKNVSHESQIEKKHIFEVHTSDFHNIHLICYGATSPRECSDKIVIAGELVRAKEIGEKVFVATRLKVEIGNKPEWREIEYLEDAFFVEDIIQDTEKNKLRFLYLYNELLRKQKRKMWKNVLELENKIEVASDITIECDCAHTFFEILRREFLTYGEVAIAKYFEDGKVQEKTGKRLIEVTLQEAKQYCADKAKEKGVNPVEICRAYFDAHAIKGKPEYTPEKLSALIASEKYQGRQEYK